MRKNTFTGLIASCILFILLLSACMPVGGGSGSPASPAPGTPTAHSTPTQAASGSLEQVDWSNFTYTFACFTNQSVAVTMKNGEANANGIHYTISKAVFGDLTGDGQPEAAIIYHCEGGGTSPARVFIYTGAVTHPGLLADLPGDKDTLATVLNTTILAGLLQLSGYGYTSSDPLCCPSLIVTTTYRWNGSSFEIVTSKSAPISTATPSI